MLRIETSIGSPQSPDTAEKETRAGEQDQARRHLRAQQHVSAPPCARLARGFLLEGGAKIGTRSLNGRPEAHRDACENREGGCVGEHAPVRRHV